MERAYAFYTRLFFIQKDKSRRREIGNSDNIKNKTKNDCETVSLEDKD